MGESTVEPELATDGRVTRRAWLVLIATSLGIFLVGVDTSIANVAFPDLQADFPSASTADLSWVLTFYSVSYAGLLIVGGRIADRIGRRRVYIIGLATFVLSSVAVAAAPSVGLIVAMRGVQGVGAALLTPASLGLVIAAWPYQRRTTAVAIWGSVLAVAVSVGPTLGGLIIELSSWRWAFLVNVPIGMFALGWGRRILIETERDPDATRPDLIGSILITAATSGVALAIVQGDEWGWTSIPVIGLVACSAASLAIIARRTVTHPDPIVPRALLLIPTFRTAALSLFVFCLGFFSMFLSMILFLTDVWGYSTLRAGVAITAVPVCAAISANVCGRLAERIGFRAIIVPGTLSFALGALWLWARMGAEPDFLADLLPAQVLIGFGVGAAPSILTGAGVAAVGPAHFSVASAVGQTARQLGGAIGLAILVAILGRPSDTAATLVAFDRVFLYLATVTALAGLIATQLRPAR